MLSRTFLLIVLFGDIVNREAENGELLRQQIVAAKVVERREELARGQIAGGAEDHHDAAIGDAALFVGRARGSD